MMLAAGTRRAVVAAPRRAPGLLRAAPLAVGAIAGPAKAPCPAGCPAAWAAVPDEVAELLALEEHPVTSVPPPSRTPPIMRPATAPRLVRPGRARRRVELCVFSMPL